MVFPLHDRSSTSVQRWRHEGLHSTNACARVRPDRRRRERPTRWISRLDEQREEFADFLQAGTGLSFPKRFQVNQVVPAGRTCKTSRKRNSAAYKAKTLLEFYVGTVSPGRIVDTPEGRFKVWAKTRFGTPTPVILKFLVEPSMLTARGKTRDDILGKLIDTLRRANPKPFMQCPQCRQIFYRKGKQIFCSRTCTNREMTQRMRKREAEAMETKTRKTKKGRMTIHGKTKTEKER
jgi:hypothetical protein